MSHNMDISRSSYAFVVDDKSKQRRWGQEALQQIGYAPQQIVTCCFGDQAFRSYRAMKEQGADISIVLTDYHMDVRRKPPQDYTGSVKNARILDGISLAQNIWTVDANQRIILVSRGLDNSIINLAQENGLFALYKRQPEESRFQMYVEAIQHYTLYGCPQQNIHQSLQHTRQCNCFG